MPRLTFGVSASSFAASMALRQNVRDHQHEYPRAAKVAMELFYVDDGLEVEDSVDDAIRLRGNLLKLFPIGRIYIKEV